jgi:hypothetical protein
MTDQDRPGNTEQAPGAQDGLEDGPVFERRFWSTVRFPPEEAIPVIVGVTLAGLGAGCLYDGPLYGLFVAALVAPVALGLWSLLRVVKAWVEWRSRWRLVEWFKWPLRYLMFDVSERR